MGVVPENHESLGLFVECVTGLTLDGQDVRILPRDEWKKRTHALAATGWREDLSALQADTFQPLPIVKEPIVIDAGMESLKRVVYSGNGKRLASCSNKQTKVWDTASQKLVQEFAGNNTGALAICLSRDGKQLITGGGIGLRWWNVDTGALERTIRFENNVFDIAISPDEQLVAIAQLANRKIHILRRETGELVAACGGRGNPDLLGEDSVIAVFEVDSWKLWSAFTADRYNVAGISISPDCQWIAGACHASHLVKLWKVPPTRSEAIIDWKPAKVFDSPYWQNAVTYSPDGKLLAHSNSVELENGVSMIRLDAKASISLPIYGGASDLAFSPDGTQFATCSRDGTVSLWDVKSLLEPAL